MKLSFTAQNVQLRNVFEIAEISRQNLVMDSQDMLSSVTYIDYQTLIKLKM